MHIKHLTHSRPSAVVAFVPITANQHLVYALDPLPVPSLCSVTLVGQKWLLRGKGVGREDHRVYTPGGGPVPGPVQRAVPIELGHGHHVEPCTDLSPVINALGILEGLPKRPVTTYLSFFSHLLLKRYGKTHTIKLIDPKQGSCWNIGTGYFGDNLRSLQLPETDNVSYLKM